MKKISIRKQFRNRFFNQPGIDSYYQELVIIEKSNLLPHFLECSEGIVSYPGLETQLIKPNLKPLDVLGLGFCFQGEEK
jgi:hypothetical protein